MERKAAVVCALVGFLGVLSRGSRRPLGKQALHEARSLATDGDLRLDCSSTSPLPPAQASAEFPVQPASDLRSLPDPGGGGAGGSAPAPAMGEQPQQQEPLLEEGDGRSLHGMASSSSAQFGTEVVIVLHGRNDDASWRVMLACAGHLAEPCVAAIADLGLEPWAPSCCPSIRRITSRGPGTS